MAVLKDDSTPLISFIIPAYNVESYLSECLSSIVALQGVKYEVIIIDDGSTDNTVASILNFVEANPNVHLLHKENGGMSVARNIGMQVAVGEYLCFVDSDDKIDPVGLANLAQRIEGEEDMVIGDFSYWYDNRIEYHTPLTDHTVYQTGEYFLQHFYLTTMQAVVWRNLYRREFLMENNLQFLSDIVFEDAEFSPRCLYAAGKVRYIPEHIYYYRKREGSTLNSSFSIKKYQDLLTVAKRAMALSLSVTDPRTFDVLDQLSATTLCTALKVARQADLRQDDAEAFDLLKNLKLSNKKYRVLQFLAAFSKPLFYLLLRFRK